MFTLPPALDWSRQQFIRMTVVWDATIYRGYKNPPTINPSPPPQDEKWHSLAFDKTQLDKFPKRGGIYAFIYRYSCLGFPEQGVVLYVGEAGNLYNRFKGHFRTSEKGALGISPERPLPDHEERLKYLFSTFEGLTVRYRVIDATQKERREFERTLINLLDPPFNWKNRPKPTENPVVGQRPRIPVKEGVSFTAFS